MNTTAFAPLTGRPILSLRTFPNILVPVNRNLWTQSLSTTRLPAWPCPLCKKGTFQLIPETFKEQETVESKSWHSHDDWDPEWVQRRFTAWAKCSRTECGEIAVIAGRGSESPSYDYEEGEQWHTEFNPTAILPAPHIIELPEKCPKPIRELLEESFLLYWADQAGAANKLRIALERLLDHIGVAASGTLHSRLEAFQKLNPAVGNLLMAIKWLGNTASHVGKVTQSELLDAYELIEHSLSEIISERSKRVAQIAATLEAKHKK